MSVCSGKNVLDKLVGVKSPFIPSLRLSTPSSVGPIISQPDHLLIIHVCYLTLM